MVEVGNYIKILKNNLEGCQEKVGAILEVMSTDPIFLFTTTTDPKYISWVFHLDGLKKGYFEIVEPKSITQEHKENPVKEVKKGLRYNADKLRWRNFPMFLMKPLIQVAQYGESKYATFNFLDGQTTLDSMDSLKRHLELFESPYDPDEDHESKVNHLAHVAWNALVALHMLKTRPELDDRFKLPESK